MSHVYKLIGCEIMFREICLCAAKSSNIIDLQFMPKNLHDIGKEKMSAMLQEEINKVDIDRYEAILLCYGLCNYGVAGLYSKIPLVIPRAHDCITLLLGSKERYSDYFNNNPGTFFKSTGWIERDVNPSATDESVTSQLGMNINFDDYDEETAEYLKETLGDWGKNYTKYTYIDTGTGNSDLYEKYKEATMAEAKSRNWDFEKIEGDICLIQDLMDGNWHSDKFLVVPPLNKISATYGDDIISCEAMQ